MGPPREPRHNLTSSVMGCLTLALHALPPGAARGPRPGHRGRLPHRRRGAGAQTEHEVSEARDRENRFFPLERTMEGILTDDVAMIAIDRLP